MFRRMEAMEQRVDIEEANNLAEELPERVQPMSKELFHRLDSMKASYPYFNPHFKRPLPNKEKVCKPLSNGRKGDQVWARFEERGAKVSKGQLIYTLNGGQRSEEWFRAPAKVEKGRLVATLPKGATHYLFNLIDENNFLVSYPDVIDMLGAGKTKPKGKYSATALVVSSK